jgi:hypothetical protein
LGYSGVTKYHPDGSCKNPFHPASLARCVKISSTLRDTLVAQSPAAKLMP